jgi:hypothetical protein
MNEWPSIDTALAESHTTWLLDHFVGITSRKVSVDPGAAHRLCKGGQPAVGTVPCALAGTRRERPLGASRRALLVPTLVEGEALCVFGAAVGSVLRNSC